MMVGPVVDHVTKRLDGAMTAGYVILRVPSTMAEVFLRHTIGARAISMFGFYLICLAVMASVVFAMLGGGIPFSPLLFTYALAFIAAGVFHQVMTFRRENIRGDYSIHSYTAGQSWLYPSVARLWEKLPVPFDLTELRYQRFVEPGQVMLLGLLLAPLDVFLGGFLLVIGFSLLVKQQIEWQIIWNEIRDAIDSRIEAEALTRAVSDLSNPGAVQVNRPEPPLAKALAATLKGQQLKSVAEMLMEVDPAFRNLQVSAEDGGTGSQMQPLPGLD